MVAARRVQAGALLLERRCFASRFISASSWPCARAIQRPSSVTGWIWPSTFVSWFCMAIDGLIWPDAMRW